MRTFKCAFDLSTSTDGKLRWDEDIDGTKFSIYIPKWRVPEPTPETIVVKIYDASLFNPEERLWPIQKRQLSKAGLTDEQIEEIDEWVPVRLNEELHSDRPITAAVKIDRIHTQTVRYTPIGHPKSWEIGQPYVPMSVLPRDYPKRLIIRVTWIT
jgi:hypothetical protein